MCLSCCHVFVVMDHLVHDIMRETEVCFCLKQETISLSPSPSFCLPVLGGKHSEAHHIRVVINEIHLLDRKITNLHRSNNEMSSEALLQSHQWKVSFSIIPHTSLHTHIVHLVWTPALRFVLDPCQGGEDVCLVLLIKESSSLMIWLLWFPSSDYPASVYSFSCFQVISPNISLQFLGLRSCTHGEQGS